MSKPSTNPTREADIATLRNDVEQLKVLTRGLRPHRLRDHTDVIVQGATAGASLAYGGEAAGGKWGPGSAAVGAQLAAYFNNTDGSISSGKQHFDQAWSAGSAAPTWLEFPYGGTDRTQIRVLEPGIYVAVFHATSGLGNFDVEVTGGSGGAIGHSGAAAAQHSVSGSVPLDPSAFGTDQLFQVATSGQTTIYGQLAIMFYPAPLLFANSGGGWAWEDTSGW